VIAGTSLPKPGATIDALRQVLPRGGALPFAEWQRRHRVMVWLIWANVLSLPTYGALSGALSGAQTAGAATMMLLFATAASLPQLGRLPRSVASSLALLTSAALLVQVSGGLIEAHFYFFVLIVLLTLYEDWIPFLLAVAYVLVHHGAIGTIDPKAVYNRPEEWAHPWRWAIVHAVFVAGSGVAGITAWRLNEKVRSEMRDVQRELAAAATIDSLTGLANRRKLMVDLAAFASGEEHESTVLVLLDLNGFKLYNDRFGHLAGDALLARLGSRLEHRAGPGGGAYRLGGDEFCVVASGDLADVPEIEAAAAAALCEHGEAFSVTSSFGSVVVPAEAADPEAALRVADQRMYAQKNSNRESASVQTKSVLVQALTERHPALENHVYGVGELAEAVARRLGLDAHEAAQIRRAAELHDVGKVAIPDGIIQKAGPLTEDEWDFMRRHPVIGERILAAAPALADLGPLVRWSHERFDGTGYPDRLAGEEIPLGARVIAVCDSFDAIVGGRPYRAARNLSWALEELRRCAGTQFDPRVVDAFCAAIEEQDVTPAVAV
jgi:diguanylate cyclase (GGDEF)-like protein